MTAALGDWIGWRATLVAISLIAVAVAGAIHWTVPSGGRGVRASGRAVWGVLTHRVLAQAMAVTLFQMAAQFATYAVIVVYLADRYGIGPAILPVALFGFGVGGVVGNVLAMRLVDRLGAELLIQGSLTSSGLIFLALQALPGGLVLGIVLLTLWAVAGMALFAPQQTRLIRLAPEQANLLLALNGSAIYLGMAGGAALSGLMLTAIGVTYLPLASAGLIGLALVGFLISERSSRAAGAGGEEPDWARRRRT